MTSSRPPIAGWGLTLIVLAPLVAALATATDTAHTWLDPTVWRLLADTAGFAAMAACVGALAGYALGRAGLGWSIVGCVPMVMPSSLLGSAWIVALGRAGPLGHWLTIYDLPIAAAAVGLRYVGPAALIVAAQYRGAGPAAKVYALRHRWWWLGVKPAVGPFVAAFTLLFILCSADHIMPSLFLIHTYGTQVLIQYNALNDLPGAAALAAPMLLIGMLGAGLVWWVIRSENTTESHERENGLRWLASPVLLIAAGVPLAAIVWRVGSWGALWEAMNQLWPEALHTGRLALIAGVLCAGMGWVLARLWLSRHRRGRYSPVMLVMLNLVAPPSMLSIGLIDLFSRRPLVWLRDTDVPLIAGYMCRFLPIAVLLLFMAGLRQPALPFVAAKLYRVRRIKRVWHVYWPAWRGALGAVFILCGLLVATELEASLLLTPAGTSTVGVRLYTLIHTAPDAQVSAAALSVLLMLLPFVALGGWLLWRRRT